MATAIQVTGLHKSFGDVKALDNLNMTVPEGTVHGLLGPNGSGKTTTVRVLSTLALPDEGHAEVFGNDVSQNPHQVRNIISLTGQYAAVDEVLTGRENLEMIGRLFKLSRAACKARTEELIERFDLESYAHRRIKAYSGGMRRRLDLAASLMARPRLVFLDEPTTGLDPRSRLDVWRVVSELKAEGITVLLTTQYLEEVDRLADSLSVIDQGRVIARGTPEELKAQVGQDWAEVALFDITSTELAAKALRENLRLDPVADLDTMHLKAPVTDGGALADLLHLLKELDIPIRDVSVRRPTLDHVFLAVTGEGIATSAQNGSEGQKEKSL